MRVAFILFFSLITIAASAQFDNLSKRKPWEEKKYETRRNVLIPQVIPLQQQQQDPEPGVKKLPLKGKYVGTNYKGDRIYAMQPDNMPCLVPPKSFVSNMPVAKQQKDTIKIEEPDGSKD